MPAPLSRRTALTLSAASVLGACAQPRMGSASAYPALPDLRSAPPASLPGSHELDLRDPASGNVWRVFVQVPDGPAPAGGYPVLYLLDGNASFFLAAQLARNTGFRPGAMRPDPLMVVGIGYTGDKAWHMTARKRDYTPPPAHLEDGSGGSEPFLDFIERQLQPAIQSAWKVDAARQTLFGHSFGGLLTLHTMATRTPLFTRYAAASPSLWWNNGQELQTIAQWMERADFSANLQIQLRVGSLERARPANDPQRAAKQAERRMNEHVEGLAARLTALNRPQLLVDYKELPGLDHGSVLAPALMEALAFAQRDAV